jgi:hypothetical protein
MSIRIAVKLTVVFASVVVSCMDCAPVDVPESFEMEVPESHEMVFLAGTEGYRKRAEEFKIKPDQVKEAAARATGKSPGEIPTQAVSSVGNTPGLSNTTAIGSICMDRGWTVTPENGERWLLKISLSISPEKFVL